MDKPKPTTGFTNQIHSEAPLGNDTSKLVWMQAWGQCSCPSPWSRQGKIKSIFHSSQSQVTSITGRFMWIEFKFQVFHHQVILANLWQFQIKDSPALGSRELTSAAVATQPWKMLNAKAEITATSEKNAPRLKFSTNLVEPCQVLPCFGNGQGERTDSAMSFPHVIHTIKPQPCPHRALSTTHPSDPWGSPAQSARSQQISTSQCNDLQKHCHSTVIATSQKQFPEMKAKWHASGPGFSLHINIISTPSFAIFFWNTSRSELLGAKEHIRNRSTRSTRTSTRRTCGHQKTRPRRSSQKIVVQYKVFLAAPPNWPTLVLLESTLAFRNLRWIDGKCRKKKAGNSSNSSTQFSPSYAPLWGSCPGEFFSKRSTSKLQGRNSCPVIWAEVTSSIIMIVIPLMHNWKQKMKKNWEFAICIFLQFVFFAKNLLTKLNGTFASLATKRRNTQSIACEKSAQESVLHWVEHCKWRSAKWRSSYVNILCH